LDFRRGLEGDRFNPQQNPQLQKPPIKFGTELIRGIRMIRQKLESLPFASQEPNAKKEFFRQALKYTLNTTPSKKLNDAARAVGVFPETKDLKHNFLKGHPYPLSKYWKAVVATTGQNKCGNCVNYAVCSKFGFANAKTCSHFKADVPSIAARHGVDLEDITLTTECLTHDDIKKVHKKYSKRIVQQQHFTLDEVFEELYAWTNRHVWNQFKFILKHYWYLEDSDLVHDLLMEGYLRALECDTIMNRLHFINTIKQRIEQRSVNLVKYLTAGTRQRIALDKADEMRQIERLAALGGDKDLTWDQKLKKYEHAVDKQYILKHLSVDFKAVDDDDNEETNLDLKQHHAYQIDPKQEDSLYEKQFLSRLIKDLPNDAFRRMIKILMGYYDSEYSNFIKNEILNDKEKFGRMLAFFNMSQEKFYSGIEPALIKNGVTNFKQLRQLKIATH
jgi:hypothetical protein